MYQNVVTSADSDFGNPTCIEALVLNSRKQNSFEFLLAERKDKADQPTCETIKLEKCPTQVQNLEGAVRKKAAEILKIDPDETLYM